MQVTLPLPLPLPLPLTLTLTITSEGGDAGRFRLVRLAGDVGVGAARGVASLACCGSKLALGTVTGELQLHSLGGGNCGLHKQCAAVRSPAQLVTSLVAQVEGKG